MQEDSIADVTPRSYDGHSDANIDITYEIVEDSSIRGRDQLFWGDGFSYTIKTRNFKKQNTL